MNDKICVIVLGIYSKSKNAIAEKRVNKELVTIDFAINYINTHKDKPLYCYVAGSENTEIFQWSRAMNNTFEKELKKVVN